MIQLFCCTAQLYQILYQSISLKQQFTIFIATRVILPNYSYDISVKEADLKKSGYSWKNTCGLRTSSLGLGCWGSKSDFWLNMVLNMPCKHWNRKFENQTWNHWKTFFKKMSHKCSVISFTVIIPLITYLRPCALISNNTTAVI